MSARTKSERLRRLVSHGYFAPELPPCFVSDDLAKYRHSVLAKIDALSPVNGKPASHRYVSEPASFYFPRFGKEDRKHGVPNPIAHLLLSRAIANNYVDLRRKARASSLTLSPPVFDWSGSRALMRANVDLRDHFRVDLSSRREEYVAADVRAFFHSIYTHAIPWAIHGKNWSKQNRGVDYYGNLLDLLCRNSQDGQTIGLPVGPDTSRLIAEVIASAMDAQLQSRLKLNKRDASRYIDDYTLSSGSGERPESLLAALRETAAGFELELNAEKSRIFSTSHRQSIGWQEAVRAQVPKRPFDDADIRHFFYQLGQLCTTQLDINVEKFGLQNARSVLVNAISWSVIQSTLISSYRRNSSLISFFVEVCLLRQAARGDVDTDDLREFIENRIPILTRANRTGEVIWLLFLAIRLQLVLRSQALSTLGAVDNSFVALLVSYLSHKGLMDGDVDKSNWNRSLNAAGLRSPMWLYAYEATTQGLLVGVDDTFIYEDTYFSLLNSHRIRFMDIEQGYASISATTRILRVGNDRMQRLRDAIRRATANDLDDFDDDKDDHFDLGEEEY